MRVVAVDWSGAAGTRLRSLWVGTAEDGRLLGLEPVPSRRQAVDGLVAAADDAGGRLVVGLDFAFSFPAWFLRQHGIDEVTGLWRLAAAEGERWLGQCPAPFWGRPGTRRPDLPAALRATEATAAATGGIRPKSAFQIGGAGAVGTGSVRGMPHLLELRQAGFAVWPFDPPALPLVVEIYPRLLTGPVAKRDPAARADYLRDLPDPVLPAALAERAAASEDAFDAAVSALVMSRHAASFAALDRPGLPDVDLEGAIWAPPAGAAPWAGAGRPPVAPAGAFLDAAAVADRLAIAELVHRYAQAADRADGEAVAALFTEDGTLVVYDRPGTADPRPPRRGRPAIAAAVASLARYRATSHVIGNHTATVHGAEAEAETRCVAHHVSDTDEGPTVETWHLRYFDRFRRVDATWLLVERVLRVDFTVTGPAGL